MDIREQIERARSAQQNYDQCHDVQLEIRGWNDLRRDTQSRIELQEELADDFMTRRREQIEFETGRDPRD